MKSSTRDLTSGSIYRSFILFTIPLVFSTILSQAFGTVDTIIAGRCIGDQALAATASAASFHSLFNAIFWGFSTGFGVYVAQLFGAKRYRELKTVLYSSFLILSVLILCMSGLTLLLREPLFRYLKVDPLIYDDAMTYFVIVMCGKVLTLGVSLFLFTMNALGNTAFPFLMSFITSLLNLGGNLFTVLVLDWGVAGLAASTLFSAFVSIVAYMIAIRRCFAQLLGDTERERFRLDLSAFRHALRYAGPVSAQQMVMYACSFGLAPLVNGMGAAATAGYAIALKAYDMCHAFFYSSSRTLSNYVAQCAGAGKFRDVPRGVRVGALQGLVFLSVPLALFILLPEQICGLFFDSGYEGMALTYAIRFCRVYLPFIFLAAMNNLFHAFFRGFGAMRVLIVSTTIETVSRLTLSYLLIGSMAMDGIFLAWLLSWAVELVFSLGIYLSSFRNEQQLRRRHISL